MTVAAARGEIAERYCRVCEEVGPAVTVVVATKYVSAEELGTLAEAGVAVSARTVRRSSSRRRAPSDSFRWHFIGHLQSNKVKVVNGLIQRVDSMGSDSATRGGGTVRHSWR